MGIVAGIVSHYLWLRQGFPCDRWQLWVKRSLHLEEREQPLCSSGHVRLAPPPRGKERMERGGVSMAKRPPHGAPEGPEHPLATTVTPAKIVLRTLLLHCPECHSVSVVVYSFSRVWLFATPWTIACQAPLSMGFSRQEYWSGLPCPPPRDLPDPGIKPASPALADRLFTTKPLGKPNY